MQALRAQPELACVPFWGQFSFCSNFSYTHFLIPKTCNTFWNTTGTPEMHVALHQLKPHEAQKMLTSSYFNLNGGGGLYNETVVIFSRQDCPKKNIKPPAFLRVSLPGLIWGLWS